MRQSNQMATKTEIVETLALPIVRWASATDALQHIEIATGCDRATAMVRLREAIAAGNVAVAWSEPDDDRDTPPAGRFWKDVSIRTDHEGEVLDQVRTSRDNPFLTKQLPSEGRPRWRGFVVDRNDLHELWPFQTEPIAPHRKALVGKALSAAIREQARVIYAERTDDPPNMVKAERLIREKIADARRSKIRQILHEDEFAMKRRPSGVRRKRKACQ